MIHYFVQIKLPAIYLIENYPKKVAIRSIIETWQPSADSSSAEIYEQSTLSSKPR